MKRAVFLDRDGVIIEDVNVLTDSRQVRLLPEVPEALIRLRRAGFQLLVVTNQPVVARGLISESDLLGIHAAIQRLLRATGADLDAAYFCPHHPNATLPEYRRACECRKPKPGMLLQAAREHMIDLGSSFMVGDRMSDIVAGAQAGCRTVLVKSAKHLDPPIQGAENMDPSIHPDFTCPNLSSAAEWILHTA